MEDSREVEVTPDICKYGGGLENHLALALSCQYRGLRA